MSIESIDEFYASLSTHKSPRRARSHFWDIIKKRAKPEIHPMLQGIVWPIPDELLIEVGNLFVVNEENLSLEAILQRIIKRAWKKDKFIASKVPSPEQLNQFIMDWKIELIKIIGSVLEEGMPKKASQDGASFQKYIKYKTKYLNLKNK